MSIPFGALSLGIRTQFKNNTANINGRELSIPKDHLNLNDTESDSFTFTGSSDVQSEPQHSFDFNEIDLTSTLNPFINEMIESE